LIAVDTNILVYAHRDRFPQHRRALAAIRRLAEGPEPWALPVFVLGEFLRVVTHLRFLQPPSDEREALAALDAVLQSPTVRVLSPGERYWELLRETVADTGARGNLILDAQIVAVCREHGVETILSEDRGFKRFPWIRAMRLTQFSS